MVDDARGSRGQLERPPHANARRHTSPGERAPPAPPVRSHVSPPRALFEPPAAAADAERTPRARPPPPFASPPPAPASDRAQASISEPRAASREDHTRQASSLLSSLREPSDRPHLAPGSVSAASSEPKPLGPRVAWRPDPASPAQPAHELSAGATGVADPLALVQRLPSARRLSDQRAASPAPATAKAASPREAWRDTSARPPAGSSPAPAPFSPAAAGLSQAQPTPVAGARSPGIVASPAKEVVVTRGRSFAHLGPDSRALALAERVADPRHGHGRAQGLPHASAARTPSPRPTPADTPQNREWSDKAKSEELGEPAKGAAERRADRARAEVRGRPHTRIPAYTHTRPLSAQDLLSVAVFVRSS